MYVSQTVGTQTSSLLKDVFELTKKVSSNYLALSYLKFLSWDNIKQKIIPFRVTSNADTNKLKIQPRSKMTNFKIIFGF